MWSGSAANAFVEGVNLFVRVLSFNVVGVCERAFGKQRKTAT